MWYLPLASAIVFSLEFANAMVAPGSASPVCRLVIFPETEDWAAAMTGSSRAINAANKFFKMINNKIS